MNNLSSYCVLVDAKIRASDKDLPVSFVLDFYLYNKSLDIITHSKCMHNKLSPTSDHCHSRAKKGVRAQLDRVRNSEVHIPRLECTFVLQDFYFCTIFCLNTLLFYLKSLES